MLIPILVLLLVFPCWARIVNVTVDDRNGDERTGLKPEYTSSWYTWTEDPPRNVSKMWDIDLSQVHDRTLSQAGFKSGNVTLRFKGTAIYVFFVVSFPRDDTGLYGENRLAFYLDDATEPVSIYGTSSTDYQYNHLVFNSGSLAQGTHALVVENDSQTMFFDYAVYTADDSKVSGDLSAETTDSESIASSTRSIVVSSGTSSHTTPSHTTTPPSDTPAAKNGASLNYGGPTAAIALGALVVFAISL